MKRRGSGGRPRYGAAKGEPIERLNLTIAPSLKERLTRYCESEERSISWVVSRAIEDFLKEKGAD